MSDTAMTTTSAGTGDVSVTRTEAWNGGFVHEFDFTAATTADDWTIVISLDAEITNIWGVTIDARVGDLYTLSGSSWQDSLDAGQTAAFGFQGAGEPEFEIVSINGAEPGTSAEPEAPATEDDTTQDTSGDDGTTDETSDPVVEEPAVTGTPETEEADTAPRPTLDYRVSATWNGGYNAALTVKNETREAMDTWSLIVSADDLDVRNAWGMTVTDLGDGTFELTGAGYGASLHPGQSVDIGFTGAGVPPEDLDVASDDSPSDGDDGTTEPPTDDGTTDPAPGAFGGAEYAEALDLSMDFYYAQYSGELPDDHPVAWRGDSALPDGADVGRDLTGGFYDAGDHVKFGLPQAYTATTLAWGAIDFRDGYEAAGSYDDLVAHVDWVSDYLLRCYDDNGTADLSDDVFYGQVGNGQLDHAYWGAPEDMTMERPAYAITADTPGTEVTAQTAAALAASSMVLGEAGQGARADQLLANAEKLFAFSEAYQGTYTDAIPDAGSFYASHSGYDGELAWAATWLYEATGEAVYLQKAESYYSADNIYWAMSWDDQSMGTALQLAKATGDQRYFDDLDAHFDHWEYSVARTPGTDTNEGLAWLDQWGSNRYAANTAFLAMDYAELLDERGESDKAQALREFASDQIDYMLGDNPDAFSYLVGFGDDFPLQPHHRAASGTDHVGESGPNEHVLDGALVGGPDRNGDYTDLRSDYVANEVAIDYNAGFSGALAGLIEQDQFLLS